MEIKLPYMPDRPEKPRKNGITMMMDKGLSIREVENFIETAGKYADIVKLGFGTAIVTTDLIETKIRLYQEAKIKVYLGGTLFEVFAIRGMFDEYLKLLEKLKLDTAEISDGSMYMPHEQKLDYIRKLSRYVTVLSEVGSKQKGVEIPDEIWIAMMKTELAEGSWKVIAEARESGTVGIYHKDGSANEELISHITGQIDSEKILWEAPTGKQQVWFIKLLGAAVNLGNIAPVDIIPLECLRLGLRGDTFFDFLPDELKNYRPDSDKYKAL
ncbi:MAG: phosphosulfolactate synthase [Bacteroidales bacterium]|nr:phosphosulfolactate synthase [Bacteroidales bacterium]MBN2763322.1 phosphosulfolactate synthase [Bacteroidales bacterium]